MASKPLIREEQHKIGVEDIRRRIRTKGAALVAFMDSPVGKNVIDALEELFYDGDTLFDPDPHVTAYNLGRRDVVSYLKQLKRLKEKDDGIGTT